MSSKSTIDALVATAKHFADQFTALSMEEKQQQWEGMLLDVQVTRDKSTASRKLLAEATKDFKKLNDAEKLEKWGGLLKSYQAEIDQLTRRSKTSDSAFLSIFEVVQKIQNPGPLIATLSDELQSLAKINDENLKNLSELDEYKQEITSLKNQDVTIRRLEEKIRAMQKESEERMNEAAEEERGRMWEEMDAMKLQIAEREREMESRLVSLRDARDETMRLYSEAQNDLFQQRSKFDESLAAKQSQIELLSEENERSSLKIATLEREKEVLNSQYLELWKKHFAPTEQ